MVGRPEGARQPASVTRSGVPRRIVPPRRDGSPLQGSPGLGVGLLPRPPAWAGMGRPFGPWWRRVRRLDGAFDECRGAACRAPASVGTALVYRLLSTVYWPALPRYNSRTVVTSAGVGIHGRKGHEAEGRIG